MFKVSVIIILIASILTQSLSKGIIVLSYFTNKQAYERYCINKAHPQLHCDGKCQLGKKIKAEEERDQKDPLKQSVSEMTIINKDNFTQIARVYIAPVVKQNLFPYSIGHILEMHFAHFHPPSVNA